MRTKPSSLSVRELQAKPIATTNICHRFRSKTIVLIVSVLFSTALICAITISVQSAKKATTIFPGPTNDPGSEDETESEEQEEEESGDESSTDEEADADELADVLPGIGTVDDSRQKREELKQLEKDEEAAKRMEGHGGLTSRESAGDPLDFQQTDGADSTFPQETNEMELKPRADDEDPLDHQPGDTSGSALPQDFTEDLAGQVSSEELWKQDQEQESEYQWGTHKQSEVDALTDSLLGVRAVDDSIPKREELERLKQDELAHQRMEGKGELKPRKSAGDLLDLQQTDVAASALPLEPTDALAARVEELWNQQQLMYRLVNRPDLDLSNLYPAERALDASPILPQNSEEYLFASTSIGGEARSDGPNFGYAPVSICAKWQPLYGILLDPWRLDESGILFGGAGDLGVPNERDVYRLPDKWHLKTKNEIALELLNRQSIRTRYYRVPQAFFNKKYIDDSAKIYTEEKKNLREIREQCKDDPSNRYNGIRYNGIARGLVWKYSDMVQSKTQTPAIVSQADIIVQTSQFEYRVPLLCNELVVSFKANAVLGMYTQKKNLDEHWMKARDEFLSHFGIRLPVFRLKEGTDGSKKLVRMKTEPVDL